MLVNLMQSMRLTCPLGTYLTLDADGAATQLASHEDTVAAVAFEPSGAVVATGGMDGSVRLWEVATGSLRGTLDGPTEAVEFLRWHPKGSILLAGCEDMTTWMFNAEKQQCMQVFAGHTGPVAAGAPLRVC
jgi:angio-associated migratory cell protein